MLYCCVMEILEQHTVLPSLLKLWDLVSCLHRDLAFADSLWHAQLVQTIGFHKQRKCVSGDFLSCNLAVSNHTVRSCLQVPTADDLGHLTQLEGKHIGWDCNSGHFCESVLGEKSSVI